ncbi:MAG: signal recognition particle subunit SRP19/SEC65 family protein [Candidatus Ranarchaeia archaeon]
MSIRSGDYYVIWVEYFNQDLTLRQGRRLAKHLAIKSPNLKLLSEACGALNLSFIPEGGKAFPATWWRRSGRVLIGRKGITATKHKLILQLAKKMRALYPKKEG